MRERLEGEVMVDQQKVRQSLYMTQFGHYQDCQHPGVWQAYSFPFATDTEPICSPQLSLPQVHQYPTFPVQRYAERAPRKTCCPPSNLQLAVQLPEVASPPLPVQPMPQRSKPQLRASPQEESGMDSLCTRTRCRRQLHWSQTVHPPSPKGPPSSISGIWFKNESSL